MIYQPTLFKKSELALKLLSGMKGVEIGGSIHNAFGLDIINVDRFGDPNTVYKKAERELSTARGGPRVAMPVHVVAIGDELPFRDKSFDFVISSHLIEHIFDPIKAVKEWRRVARKYIYIIVPHANIDPNDRGKPITPLEKLINRHKGVIVDPRRDFHHTRWTLSTFVEMCKVIGVKVSHTQDPDDKVGNGFTVVIDVGG